MSVVRLGEAAARVPARSVLTHGDDDRDAGPPS
jgi:hypothetical protein